MSQATHTGANGTLSGSTGLLASGKDVPQSDDEGWKFAQCFGDKGDAEENPGTAPRLSSQCVHLLILAFI